LFEHWIAAGVLVDGQSAGQPHQGPEGRARCLGLTVFPYETDHDRRRFDQADSLTSCLYPFAES
jgi:hypothetical protein